MGKDPAGHAQRQLQAPFAAAAVAAAEEPVPATTVTAEPAVVVAEAAARSAGIRLAEFIEELDEEEDAAVAEAVLFAEPATTVTGPATAAAVAALVLEIEELFDPDSKPAWTVIVAPADSAAALAELLVDAVPFPARTVTAAAVALAALDEPLVEVLLELEVPFTPA
jgi:hypothetical protein